MTSPFDFSLDPDSGSMCRTTFWRPAHPTGTDASAAGRGERRLVLRRSRDERLREGTIAVDTELGPSGLGDRVHRALRPITALFPADLLNQSVGFQPVQHSVQSADLDIPQFSMPVMSAVRRI